MSTAAHDFEPGDLVMWDDKEWSIRKIWRNDRTGEAISLTLDRPELRACVRPGDITVCHLEQKKLDKNSTGAII